MKKTRQNLSRFALWGFFLAMFHFSVMANPNTGKGNTVSKLESVLAQQQMQISGKVTNSLGEPIPGVTISVKGTNIGTITSSDGQYKLNVPTETRSLNFSFVGMKSQSIQISGKSVVNVVLEEETLGMDEVVVIGYETRKKRDVLGSVSSIRTEQVEKLPTGTLNDVLQGKAAGVDIIASTGEPGAAQSITIRGTSTLNGATAPLYIIDGVQIQPESLTQINSGGSALDPLADINPSDIESIDILKDAASAAVYGSRAANGVIIVTTKRGKSGKPKINFSTSYGLQRVSHKVGVLNAVQYRDLMITKDLYLQRTTSKWVTDSLTGVWGADYDYQSRMYQDAPTKKYEISLAGGTPNLTYRVSTSYLDQDGVVIFNTRRSQSSRVNVDYQATKNFKAGSNISFTRAKYRRNDQGNSIRSIVTIPPVFGVFRSDGTYNVMENDKLNPVAYSDLVDIQAAQTMFIGNQYFEWKPIKGLMIKPSIALTYTDVLESRFRDRATIKNALFSQSEEGANKSLSMQYNTNAFYSKSFEGHNFLGFAGIEYAKAENYTSFATGDGFISNAIRTLNAATLTTMTSSISENARLKYMGKISYDYKGKYLMAFTYVREGSSRFGKENQFADFPSAQVSWIFSDEPFMKKIKWFNTGKLRYSYGLAGNQGSAGAATAYGAYSVAAPYMGSSGVYPSTLFNPLLRWETSYNHDAALELSLFNDRLIVEPGYYHKRIEDLLFNVTLPTTTGFSGYPSNLGTLQNHGLELTLTARPISNPKFSWTIMGNIANNKNKVVELPESKDIFTTTSVVREGEPVGSFYGWKMLGVFPTDNDNRFYPKGHELEGQQIQDPNYTGTVVKLTNGIGGLTFQGGDVWFEDLNKDGIIDDMDKSIIGTSAPLFFGGIQNTLTYAGFTLNINFKYSYGSTIYSSFRYATEAMNFGNNQGIYVDHRWRKPGDITDVPRALTGDVVGNSRFSTRWLEDGTYLKLQSMALSYSIPGKYSQKIGINRAQITASGSNLLIWSNFKGYNPEVNMSGSSLSGLEDSGGYPQSRSFNIALNIEF